MCSSYVEIFRKTEGVLPIDFPRGKVCLVGTHKLNTGGKTRISVDICPIFQVPAKGGIHVVIKEAYLASTHISCPKIEFQIPYLAQIFGHRAHLEANLVCQQGKMFSGSVMISGTAGVDDFSLKLSTEQINLIKISAKRQVMGMFNIPCRFDASYNMRDGILSNSLTLSPLSRLFVGAEMRTGCFSSAKQCKIPTFLSLGAAVVYVHCPCLSYALKYTTAAELSKPIISARMTLGKRFGSKLVKTLDSLESTVELDFDPTISSLGIRAGLGLTISDSLSCRLVVNNHGVLKGAIKKEGPLEMTTGFEIDPRKITYRDAITFGVRIVMNGSLVL